MGGGGIFIPVSIAFFGFSTREAIGVSNTTIFVAALTRFCLFSIWEKHPFKNQTVINYPIASVMMPMVLVGSLVGTFLNRVLPEFILTIFMSILLFNRTYSTFKKGCNMYRKEKIA